MLLEDPGITRLWIGKVSNRYRWNGANVNRGIATNMGMPFKTPEEFFLGEAAEPATGVFDPMSYVKGGVEEPGTRCQNDWRVALVLVTAR